MNIVKSLLGWLTGDQFIMYMGGGGGGGPSTTYSQTSNIPEYAQPYVEQMLGAAQEEIFDYGPGTAPQYEDVPVYQEYPADPRTGMPGKKIQVGTERKLVPGSGERVLKGIKEYTPFNTDPSKYFAKPTMLQEVARANAGNMQVTPETNDAASMAKRAGMAALGTKYTPGQFANQFTAPKSYQDTKFTYDKVSPFSQKGGSMSAAQMTGPQDVQAQQFGQSAATQYMNPYMQSVVEMQQQDAQRQADIASTGSNAQATQAGAFGGSRQAIMNAEAAKNLASQKGNIQAQGLNAAYLNAQQQYNADQAQRMQAALANQGMGFNVGSQNLSASQQANVQNLAAKLQTQGLNAQQAMQAALANQQMGMTAQQNTEQSRQYGYGQQMTAAQQQAQYGLAAQQAAEQSRQYGAGLRMQGLQTGLQASNQLGTLGQNIYGQRMGINQLQNQLGGQQQQEQQAIINQQIQDFATKQQYPMLMLANMNALTRGLPMQSSNTSIYQAPPSAASQLAGLGTAAYGLSQLGGSGIPKAKGGRIKEKKRPAGLAELALMKMQ